MSPTLTWPSPMLLPVCTGLSGAEPGNRLPTENPEQPASMAAAANAPNHGPRAAGNFQACIAAHMGLMLLGGAIAGSGVHARNRAFYH